MWTRTLERNRFTLESRFRSKYLLGRMILSEKSATFRDHALATTELGGEPLIALATIEEVPAHRRARLRNHAAADGLHDVAVFLLERFAVDALGHPGPAADGLPRNDEAPEMLQKAP